MIINAFIQGQTLKLPRAKLVAGSNDYLEMQVVLQTGDWTGLDIWAHFSQDGKNIYDLHVENCMIRKDQHLNLAAGEWKVYFTGMEIGTGTMKITTEQQTLTVQATGFSCGDFPEVPASHAEQITKDAAAAKRLAEETRKLVTDNAPLTERAEAAAKSAEASAQQAAASAAQSSGSAGRAAQSAGAAQQAQEQAQTAAQTATSAQESAKGSMDAAGLSAQQASRDASAAAQSAAQAGESQTAATAAAGRAAGDSTSAAQSAERATRAAQSAEDDAGFAKASREAAATSEANASNSAGAALSYSEAAGASADQAQTDALTAQGAAQTANTKAAEAKASAEQAAQEVGKIPPLQEIYNTVVEATCPKFSKTAPVVTCNPISRIPYPLSVKSHLIPRQSGSGDPSPDNVRPFVPYTQAELTRCGKNLTGQTISRYIYPKDIAQCTFLKKGSYYLSAKLKNCTLYRYVFTLWDRNGNAVSEPPSDSDSGKHIQRSSVSGNDLLLIYNRMFRVYWFSNDEKVSKAFYRFTIDADYYVGFNIYGGDTTNDSTGSEVMLVSGSNLTPYEPYIGETYTAQLPAETYGGEVDWEKGQVANNKRMVSYNTSNMMSLKLSSSGEFVWRYPEDGIDPASGDVSVPSNYYGEKTEGHGVYRGGAFFRLKQTESGFSTLDEFKAAVDKTPLQVIITVATDYAPITTSGTPTAIPGVNTLYSVGGDTTVEGREDPVATIDALKDRVTALENNAVTNI